ncbi:hypothetical protein CY35_08G103000 [Sphagnum magellanicum]|nr:hypothetical protein CY35_08G103000 [Sphagnum magellanicum]KAH9555206.1 hypothetical protein CY35_08G103000 [Sphagnum magellanicum]
MSPTRSQLDVSKDGKNPNGSPNKTLRWALCLLSLVFCRIVVCSLLLPQASMGKGTGSFGKQWNKSHTLCRCCGHCSFHIQKSRCSACAYPATRIRSYN